MSIQQFSFFFFFSVSRAVLAEDVTHKDSTLSFQLCTCKVRAENASSSISSSFTPRDVQLLFGAFFLPNIFLNVFSFFFLTRSHHFLSHTLLNRMISADFQRRVPMRPLLPLPPLFPAYL